MLVVGSGNSGCDLAVDAAQHRLETVDLRPVAATSSSPRRSSASPARSSTFLQEFTFEEQDLLTRLLITREQGDVGELPGPAGAALPDARRGRAGGQRPAPLLDPARPGQRRARASSGSTGRTRPLQRRHARASTTRSCGRPASTRRCRSSTTALLQRADGVPLRTAGGIVPAGLDRLYLIGMAAPRGPQIALYPVQSALALAMAELWEARPRQLARRGASRPSSRSSDRIDMIRPGLGGADGGHPRPGAAPRAARLHARLDPEPPHPPHDPVPELGSLVRRGRRRPLNRPCTSPSRRLRTPAPRYDRGEVQSARTREARPSRCCVFLPERPTTHERPGAAAPGRSSCVLRGQ